MEPEKEECNYIKLKATKLWGGVVVVGGGCQKISQKHLAKKKNVQEKMWISMQYEHQKTHKQNENVTNLKKKPPHVPLAAGARTRTQTHPDTGIKFLVKIH